MSKQERVAAIFLMLLGGAVTYYAVRVLSLGTLQKPGSGFFPVICGIGIMVLCVIWFVATRKIVKASEPLWENREWLSPAIGAGLITVYAALMESLGYITSTLLFVVAWELAVERLKWKQTALIAITGTFAMYVMFSYLLGIPLPTAGILE